MKKYLLLTMLLAAGAGSFAQVLKPVKWAYSAKKINATTYEVQVSAVIDKGWHIYSQTTPDGGPVPTTIKFNNNALLVITGSLKEVGKLQQKHEPLFGVDVKQFEGQVKFVQLVKLKGPVKTNISGTIEFMVCDDKQCLPPAVQKFSIALQ